MPGTSTKTRVVSVRLPLDVFDTLDRRSKNGHWDSLGTMLAERITYDTRRRHGTRSKKEKPND